MQRLPRSILLFEFQRIKTYLFFRQLMPFIFFFFLLAISKSKLKFNLVFVFFFFISLAFFFFLYLFPSFLFFVALTKYFPSRYIGSSINFFPLSSPSPRLSRKILIISSSLARKLRFPFLCHSSVLFFSYLELRLVDFCRFFCLPMLSTYNLSLTRYYFRCY